MQDAPEAQKVGRLIVVSNRLPVALDADTRGHPLLLPGSGGLVTALSPVLRDHGGIWIGWLGTSSEPEGLSEIVAKGSIESGYTLHTVGLTQDDIDGFYRGFSNEILWFLFHDFILLCNFDPSYWPSYERVNRKFAETVAGLASPEDYIWIHDYHLLLVGRELRSLGMDQRLGFFLHIPFPPIDGFLKIPWRRELLEAMLQYDLLGFQTVRDTTNFLRCVRLLIPQVRVQGAGSIFTLRTANRELRVGTFPISVDFRGFAKRVASGTADAFADQISRSLNHCQLILGIDRLDHTKGIPQRIMAFGEALTDYPELRRRIALFQIVVPSRMEISRYQNLKQEIEQVVGQVNGRFTQPGWTPVHYMFRSLAAPELVAYYRMADIALVTPFKDGMNLIAKEYCACKVHNNGVLILSEFAGAAAQLHHDALIVNPFDIKGIAEAIHRAFTMDPSEKRQRMRRLRRAIQRNDVHRWLDNFLRAAFARTISDFRRTGDFSPSYYPSGSHSERERSLS